MTLWCEACSTEDHRDTTFFEPPYELGHKSPLTGWAMKPQALAPRRRRPGQRRFGGQVKPLVR